MLLVRHEAARDADAGFLAEGKAGSSNGEGAGRPHSPAQEDPAPAATRKLYRKPRVKVLQPGTVGHAKAQDAFAKPPRA